MVDFSPVLKVDVEEPDVVAVVRAALAEASVYVHAAVSEEHRAVVVALRGNVADFNTELVEVN
jgi:hypothetical protein